MFQSNLSSKLRIMSSFNKMKTASLYKFQQRLFATQNSEFVVTLKSINDYEKEVVKSAIPVLLDFYADWCAPCKKAAPFLESKANELKTFKLVKINVDNHPELSEQFAVGGIPYLVLMKNGQKIGELVGFHEAKLNTMLAAL